MTGLFKAATADAKKVKFNLNPKPVKPDGSSFSKHTPAPDKQFNVLDENGNVVGHILVPTDFCPGMSCPYAQGEKHAFSYYSMYSETGQRRWVHMYCDRPTLKWWRATFRDLVTTLQDDLFQNLENTEELTSSLKI